MISAAASAPVRPERARTCEYFFSAALTRIWAAIPGTRINTSSNNHIPVDVIYRHTSNCHYTTAAESDFKCLWKTGEVARAGALNHRHIFETHTADTPIVQPRLDGHDVAGAQYFGY